MAKSKKSKIVNVWKKKVWYNIHAPKLFNEEVVGETPASDAKLIVGRKVELNLLTLTGNLKSQNMKVTFEIDKVNGTDAYSKFFKYELLNTYIKRLVRRGRDKLYETIKCTTKDGSPVVIKILLLTRNLAKGGQLTALRKEVLTFVVNAFSKVNYDDLSKNIIAGQFQREVKSFLKKVYPVRTCEVKLFELLDTEKKRKNLRKLKVDKEEATESNKEEKAVEPEQPTTEQ